MANGMNLVNIANSETIEVLIRNVNTKKYNFTDNETKLEGARITGLAIHTAALAKSINGNTVLADAIQKKAFLTLTDPSGNEFIKKLPLETFYVDQRFILPLKDGIVIDVRKSFIELFDMTGVAVDTCFVVTFFYEKK